jgi:hypothetical protein
VRLVSKEYRVKPVSVVILEKEVLLAKKEREDKRVILVQLVIQDNKE